MKEKYGIDPRVSEESNSDRVSQSGSLLKNALINNLMLSNEINVLPIFYEDLQCTINTSTLHIYYKSIESRQTAYSIYSRDKSKAKPEWYCSCTFNRFDVERDDCSLYGLVTLEKPDYLYSYKQEDGRWLFNAHSSINLSSRPHATLTSLPHASYFQPCLAGAARGIYLYERMTSRIWWTEEIKDRLPEFNKDEYERGIYYYNCDIDKWFPVPEMKTKVSDAYLFSDHKLVYLIGGVSRPHYVQAYDCRVSQWQEIPNTLTSSHEAAINAYRDPSRTDPSCCATNGKIYLANYNLIQAFDPVACKWEKVKEYDLARRGEQRELVIAAYDNLLWAFQNRPSHYAEICDLTSLEWRDLYSAEKLHEKMYYGTILKTVVFKPLAL
jgi:hypothetical protein